MQSYSGNSGDSVHTFVKYHHNSPIDPTASLILLFRDELGFYLGAWFVEFGQFLFFSELKKYRNW
jgi:hypothetical protein